MKFWLIGKYEMEGIEALEQLLLSQGVKMQPQGINAQIVNGIGIVPIEGPLFHRRTSLLDYSGGMSYGEIQDIALKYLVNEDVREIVFLINSPGGNLAGCQEAAEVIRKVAGLKKTTSLIDGMSYSASYWIASATGRILLSSRTCGVGSIGIVFSRPFVKDDIRASGELKAAGEREESAEIEEYINNSLAHILECFLTDIRYYRNISSERIKTILRGGRFYGENAIEMGLADGFYSPFAWHTNNKIEEITL